MNISEHLARLMQQYDVAHKEGTITTGQFEALMDGVLQTVSDLGFVEEEVEVPDPSLDTTDYVWTMGPGEKRFHHAPNTPCMFAGALFMLRDAKAMTGTGNFLLYGYGGRWEQHRLIPSEKKIVAC